MILADVYSLARCNSFLKTTDEIPLTQAVGFILSMTLLPLLLRTELEGKLMCFLIFLGEPNGRKWELSCGFTWSL